MNTMPAGLFLLAVMAAMVFGATQSHAQSLEAACRDGENAAIKVSACADIIATAPSWSDLTVTLAYYRRGYAYDDLNDIDSALADIEEAMRRDQASHPGMGVSDLPPELVAARLRGHALQAAVYSDRKKYDEALRHIDAAFDLHPDQHTTALLFGLRGEVAYGQQHYQQAVEDIGRSIELDPNNRTAFLRRGDAYNRLGQYDLAGSDYDQVIRLQPTDEEGYRMRCRNSAMAGRLNQALDDCDRMLRLDDKNHSLLVLRGLVYLKMTRFQPAMEDFDAVLDGDAGQADALFGRGIVKLRLGDAAGGNADIATAKQRDVAVVDRFAQWGVTP